MSSATPSAAPPNLREFTAGLRRDGELVAIEAQVDSRLEAAEIHRRVIAAGGPALWFSNVRGCDFPLVTNLFGTASRVERAFGRWPREFIAEIARLPEELMPPTLGKLWSKRGLFGALAKVGTRQSNSGAVCEVIETPPRLARLPALQTWARDGGRFITLPLVFTQHPRTHTPNLGMYRIQLYDEHDGGSRTGLHMQIGKGGGFHLAEAEARNEALPVNVFVGGPPALMLSAIAPLPENVPEILLASLLLRKKLSLAKNPSGPLPLFADAEFALVGEVQSGARRAEGPFGDHYGYYSEIHDYPLFSCKSLCRRREPIFPATVVGKPRQEDFFLGDYLQELLSPLFPLVMPAVRDLWSYGETGYHSLGAAVVRERYRRESMSSAFRILGEGQLSLTKFLLLTDTPVDLRDFKQTLVHILERADFRTDLFLFANLSMDSLDYAGPKINEGSKGVLLGCGEKRRELPREFHGAAPTDVREVRVFVPGCLVVDGPGYAQDEQAAKRIAAQPAFAMWPLIVLCDDAARTAKSTMNFLWSTFTRFDPARDMHASKTELVHNHASHTPPVVIDARMKPGYPEELFCDEATSKLVDRRWNEYFPSRKVPMGDSLAAHLD
jgi:UbiD family decarboxylase